jgi:hypothetical protein
VGIRTLYSNDLLDDVGNFVWQYVMSRFRDWMYLRDTCKGMRCVYV